MAVPLNAATVVVPESVAPLGPLSMASVTLLVKPATVCPDASRAITSIAGAIMAPAIAESGGCTRKKRFVADYTTMLNGAVVAPVRPVAAAVSV